MQRLFLIVCLLASVFAVFAQTQHGYVKTRGRMNANGTVVSGTRLTGATITFKGRGSVTSGTDGVFTFAVPNKTFCIISVQKNGYQLYDNDLLGRNYNCSSNDLLVVMDTPDNVLADRLESEKKIRRTLRRQLQEKEDEIEVLKEQQKITEEQYRKQLQELYATQENNEKLISEMAERYSTMDFDQMDDFQRRVAAYIQNGELTRADSLLNTKGSMEERGAELDRENAVIKANAEELKKHQEEQAQSEALYAKKLEDFAADCYSRFEICKLRHDNDSAAYWLELRAKKDTLNCDWQKDVGIFVSNYLADYEMALRYYYRVLHLTQSKFGENHPDVATIYNNIGITYNSQREYFKALEMHKKALKIRIELYGENHPDVALSLYNVGAVCYSLGSFLSVSGTDLIFSTAMELFQKALKTHLEISGENHPDVANTYSGIGSVYSYQGDYPKALDIYHKSLKILLDVYGKNHPGVARSYNNIGYVYESQGNHQQAVEMLQESLKIWLDIYGENHPDVATNYNNIGDAYESLGDYPTALEMYQKALKIELKVFGENDFYVSRSYEIMSDCYFKAVNKGRKTDYNEFTVPRVFTATTIAYDTPAYTAGMTGESVVLEFADWTIESENNIVDFGLFREYITTKDEPKTIVVMKDGVISQYHFENTIGVQIGYKYVGEQEKQRILKAYKEWKKKQQ